VTSSAPAPPRQRRSLHESAGPDGAGPGETQRSRQLPRRRPGAGPGFAASELEYFVDGFSRGVIALTPGPNNTPAKRYEVNVNVQPTESRPRHWVVFTAKGDGDLSPLHPTKKPFVVSNPILSSSKRGRSALSGREPDDDPLVLEEHAHRGLQRRQRPSDAGINAATLGELRLHDVVLSLRDEEVARSAVQELPLLGVEASLGEAPERRRSADGRTAVSSARIAVRSSV